MKPNPSDPTPGMPKLRRRWVAVAILILLLLGVGYQFSAPERAVINIAPAVQSAVLPPFEINPLPKQRIYLPAGHVDTIVVLTASTQLSIPAGAFLDSTGKEVEKPVVIEFQEIMNPIETFLSGIPMALDSGRVLKSAGMVNIQGGTADGEAIQIRQDRPLELEFASLDSDSSYTAWALDTVSGVWSEMDANTEVFESDELEAFDQLESQIPPPPTEAGPFSFTIGDDTGGQAELSEYDHVRFEPVDGKPCGFTCTQIDVFKRDHGIYDVRFIGHEYGYQKIAREETCSCYLAFKEGEEYSEALRQYQRKNKKLIDAREREWKRLERAWERHIRALARQELLAEGNRAEWRQRSADKRVLRTLEVLQFGILNIDKPYLIDAPAQLMASYVDSLGIALPLKNVQVMDISNQVLYPCLDGKVALHPMRNQVLFGTTHTNDLAYIHIRELTAITRGTRAFTFEMNIARLEDLSPDALFDLLIPPT